MIGFKNPSDAQIGDKVAIYKWTMHSRQIIFTTVTKVSKRKMTVDHEIAFKTSNWRLWGEASHTYRSGVELVDEATGLRLQKQIEDEALCKTIARDANEALKTIDTDRFSRYACGWNKADLKKAIEMRKQAMVDAVAGFDQMIATLEAM